MADIDLLTVNTLRTLSIDGVQKANSGHPGLPLGCAPMAYVLWHNHLKHCGPESSWPDRDRFVLSAGHGSMLLYSLLHLYGYDLPLDELKNFRQWGSKTPGHPEFRLTPGVEATTGPLGQGTANAVGMAIAERALARMFNQSDHVIVDHRTYALVSDGDLMEGIAAEAVSLAGHLKLHKLTYLYDANDISLDGPTALTFSEDVARRFEAYGWQVITVKDGNSDLGAIDAALARARNQNEKPTLIIVRTTIGYGSPNKAGTSSAHGSPLGPDEVKRTKQQLGWDPEQQFYIPEQVKAHCQAALLHGQKKYAAWKQKFESYKKTYPELAARWQQAQSGELPVDWDASLPSFKAGEKIATRKAASDVLNCLAAKIPWLLGGDADLGCSTLTLIKEGGDFDAASGTGRNIHFGVREHAMAAIANGMAYHGGIRPYVATFFAFSDYMRPAVRLAALNHLPIVYVWTHDSIFLGEDGPTHQPVEHLMSLRLMPNMVMLRPGDANEAREAWRLALLHKSGPVGLVLSRQNLPVLEAATVKAEDVARGAYSASEAQGELKALILATGSELSVALMAQKELHAQNIGTRVVSLPSWELFAGQSNDYQEKILPGKISARVSIEAGVTFGWERFIGSRGVAIGMDRYGASAPAEVLQERFGLTTKAVVEAVKKLTL